MTAIREGNVVKMFGEKRPKRWPPKPPKDTRCDAHVGVSYDSVGSPVLNRCPNTATVTAIVVLTKHEAWLCAECAPALAARGEVLLR